MDWERWDIIVLPVKPDGCEHQHCSKERGKPRRMAFRYVPYSRVPGNMFDHVEDFTDWKNWIEREKITIT